jgi:hypothetical protein
VSDYGRAELPPVRIPCQVEPGEFESLHMTTSGNSPQTRVVLVFHFMDLERLALVDPTTGQALIRVGDRLAALCDRVGTPLETYRNPPGVFVVEARPSGYGLFRPLPRRNLLIKR